jgi:hypothetical protein
VPPITRLRIHPTSATRTHDPARARGGAAGRLRVGRARAPLTLLLPALLGTGCAETAGEARGPGSVSEISSPAGPGSGEPNLAAGPDGRVYMSWLEPAANSTHALRFAVLDGERWSAPRTIARGADFVVNWADFPSIVVLPDGRLAAHYLQRSPAAEVGYHYDIRIVQSTDGGESWSDPVSPHRDGVPAEHGFVSLFPAGGDSLGAIWLDGRKSSPRYGGTAEMTLRYAALAPDGSLGDGVELDGRICDCCQTSVALSEAGPVAVYRDRTEDEIRDIHVSRLIDGEWTAGEPVHRDGWEIAACPVNGPSISSAGSRVAVAWFTAARDTPRVMLAFSDDSGRSFGPPVRVDGGDPAGRVDVELMPDGSALVGWVERTGGEAAEVRIRTVSATGEAGEPVSVAGSSAARSSGFPRMVRAGDRVILAWTQPGAPSRIRVAQASIGGDE